MEMQRLADSDSGDDDTGRGDGGGVGSDDRLESGQGRSVSLGSYDERDAFVGDLRRRKPNGDPAGLSYVFLTVLITSALIMAGGLTFFFRQSNGRRGGDAAEQADSWHRAEGRSGAVSSTNIYATQAGLRILEAGGNAVDAAAAVQFALNVVQPESTGIGGGCMPLLYWAATGEVIAMDGREEAPAAMTETAFCTTEACDEAIPFMPERTSGGHPVGVPGVVAATAALLEEYGTMTLAEVVAPAVQLARNGVPMSYHLHDRIERNKERLSWFPASAELLLNEDMSGPIVAEGEVWRNTDLADTLETLGRLGAEWFYTELAPEIVAAVQGAVNPRTGLSGLMTVEDLAGYAAVKRRPVQFPVGDDYVAFGHALPGSGGLTMALALQIMDTQQMAGMEPMGAAALKWLADAQNIAFADRNKYMGDADFADVPVDGLANGTYARMRRDELMKVSHAASVPVPYGYPRGAERRRASDGAAPDTSGKSGTTHFSIADAFGNVVSWTTTIEENLGAAVVVPGRGFLLNNELTDFDAIPSFPDGSLSPNRVQGGKRPRRTAIGADAATSGGKRPRSSMSPTIVMRRNDDGGLSPFLALGSPGGSTIIGIVTNVLVRRAVHGLPLQEATDAPRLIARNTDTMLVEQPLASDASFVEAMNRFGLHASDEFGDRPMGFVQSVELRPDGSMVAVADSERLDTAGAAAF